MPTLLESMRDHLISEGIVRDPRVAGPDPPMWLDPRDGAPAPGERTGTENDDAAVLSAFKSGSIPGDPLETFFRAETVDVWIRVQSGPDAEPIGDALRAELAEGEHQFGRRNWVMGGTRIVESREWRGLQRLGSDRQGYAYVISFIFETYHDRRA